MIVSMCTFRNHFVVGNIYYGSEICFTGGANRLTLRTVLFRKCNIGLIIMIIMYCIIYHDCIYLFGRYVKINLQVGHAQNLETAQKREYLGR